MWAAMGWWARLYRLHLCKDGKGIWMMFLQLFLRLDNSMADTENLFKYVQAKVVGEENGECEIFYPGCPVSIKNLDALVNSIGPEMLKNFL